METKKYRTNRVDLLLFLLLLFTRENSRATSRQTNKTDTNSSMILRSVLDNYDKRIRPGGKENALQVAVDMYVANIWAMNEVNMEFTIDIYLRQYWKDERLQYKDYTSESVLTLSSDVHKQIWVPSTYFLNTKNAYFHDVTTDNYLLQVSPEGDVFYSMRLTVTTSCLLNLRFFPHDTQECMLTTESYGYQAPDVFYVWNKRKDNTSAVYLHKGVELPQFEIQNIDISEKVNTYNIGNHSSLVATFRMKRRIGYFLIDTYIPSTLIVVISWISFWIDPDTAPARVALGITTVLTMTTLVSSSRASLPKVSYVKAIDWYLLACLIFVFGTLLEYTIVSYLLSVVRRREKQQEKFYFKTGEVEQEEDTILTPASPARSLFRRDTMNTHNSSDNIHLNNFNSTLEDTIDGAVGGISRLIDSFILERRPVDIDRFSRVGFPLAFLGFNVAYWTSYGV